MLGKSQRSHPGSKSEPDVADQLVVEAGTLVRIEPPALTGLTLQEDAWTAESAVLQRLLAESWENMAEERRLFSEFCENDVYTREAPG